MDVMGSSNFLEQLAAEWFEYQGYFVRRNVHVGKRDRGGYEGELDVVAYDPVRRRIVHIECSTDGDSMEKKARRLEQKFGVGRKHMGTVFPGAEGVGIEQLAYHVSVRKDCDERIGEGRLLSVRRLIKDIVQGLSGRRVMKQAVPESFPLIRTVQFLREYAELEDLHD